MAGKFQPLYRVALAVLRPPVSALTKRTWIGAEHIPTEGGFIAAANHISEFDALTFMHFIVDQGVPVRMLAKAELFEVPVLKWIMKGVGHVPVKRGSANASDALADAVQALQDGECVGIYPEGTLTRDPNMWPMKAKTGVGRLALRSRVPVIPFAQWGAQNVLGRYRRIPNLLHRHHVTVIAGPAVDLSDLYQHADEHWAQKEATERIMQCIREQLELIRGEKAPEHIHDPKVDGGSKKEVAAADKALLAKRRAAKKNDK